MSYGAICTNCRHWTDSHDEAGKCHLKLNQAGDECPCESYKLEPGSDWEPSSPRDGLHVRVERPGLKRRGLRA